MKLKKQQLESIKELRSRMARLTDTIARLEMHKHQVIQESVATGKALQSVEDSITAEHGADVSLNLETGEINKKNGKDI